jgi:lipid II:glycine glycyltransferase (peptidoglycan interpeptide bridge formation enzyme)
MTARFATTDEIAHWDDLILQNPDGGNVFSTHEFAEIKKLTHYIPRFVIVDKVAVTILEKKTPPLGKLWYLPKGPNVTSVKDLKNVLNKLAQLAKKSRAFVIRFETELDKKYEKNLRADGYKKAAPIIPNPSTITLDISKPVDDLLLGLPQKGRHAIRRAMRDGVSVKRVEADEKNCKIMYNLLRETAEGQFGIRSYHYFKAFWQEFEKQGMGQLFFAYVDDTPVAGAYAMVLGKKSTYKDGASTRKRSVYGASHLLQWEVIAWAKEKGALVHDFCGAPPSDQIDNPSHPHHGVGRFKLSFSKNVVDYIGCYDVVLNNVSYIAWTKLIERLYRRAYYKNTKDYYY